MKAPKTTNDIKDQAQVLPRSSSHSYKQPLIYSTLSLTSIDLKKGKLRAKNYAAHTFV